MILKHVKNTHKGESTSFTDVEHKFRSTKLLHGVCKNEKLYEDKKSSFL